MAATRIALFEDDGTPVFNLQKKLEQLGFQVIRRLAPVLESIPHAVSQHPDLALIVVSLPCSERAIELGRGLQEDSAIPVIYLAGQPGLALLKHTCINDPFSILHWPVDDHTLRAHLEMCLQKTVLERQLKDRQDQVRTGTHYRTLFEESPISLWEEDFSMVRRALKQLREEGITDFRAYFTEHPEMVRQYGLKLRILDINQSTLRMYKASSRQELIENLDRLLCEDVNDLLLEELIAIAGDQTRFEGEGVNQDLEGNRLDIFLSWSTPPGDEESYSRVIISVTDISARKRREDVLNLIATNSAELRSLQTRAQILPAILAQTARHLHVTSAALALQNLQTREILFEQAIGEWAPAAGRRQLGKTGPLDNILTNSEPYTTSDIRHEAAFSLSDLVKKDVAVAAMPLLAQNQSIGVLWIGRATEFSRPEIDLLRATADIAANAIHGATLLAQSNRYAEQVATASDIGQALSTTLDLDQIYPRLAQGVLEMFPNIASIFISTFDAHNKQITYQYGIQDGEPLDMAKMLPIPLDSANVGSQGEVIRTRRPLIVNDLASRRRFVHTSILGNANVKSQSSIYVPMLAKDEILGVMFVQSDQPNRFNEADSKLLTLVANTAAVAILNASLFAATQRRVDRLTALHAIDVAISSSLDLRVTLNIVLDQLVALLQLDAADILMLDSATQTLVYASGRGFRSAEFNRARLKLGEGLPGRVVLDNTITIIHSLGRADASDRRIPLITAEGFTGYSAAPLVAKGQVKGVLEIFHRGRPDIDPEWKEFLETLAGQVAVAIDNTTLVNQLQRSNLELTLAYDSTLEGWSRAMDLRDKNTEDHSDRVAELTVRLAKAMGLMDAEIIQIRRGALLHDIGKLGIPDRILQKSGPLLDEERAVMDRHPDYANEMLKSIDFLAPARVIPLYHHEKWDGTGYPHGLKGEQIPLAARIFSIVDVWDSLCSDRPYRLAWPVEKAREYILAESGKHFDPVVVEHFLKVISS